MEFAFSIVNVAIGTISNLFEIRRLSLRFAWLLYSLSHIPLALIITLLQRELGADMNLMFWNYMYVLCSHAFPCRVHVSLRFGQPVCWREQGCDPLIAPVG